jgi:hypothetical protein
MLYAGADEDDGLKELAPLARMVHQICHLYDVIVRAYDAVSAREN